MMGDKKAISFLEIIISLSLISIAILGTWQVLEVGMMSVYKNNQEVIATNLARGLMAEIMAKPFFDPQDPTNTALGLNGETTGNKLTFDDVDDYNLYNETTPKTIAGVSMDYYNGFSRSVTVDYVNQDMIFSDNSPTDFKRVTVTVTAAGIANTVLVEVKVNL